MLTKYEIIFLILKIQKQFTSNLPHFCNKT